MVTVATLMAWSSLVCAATSPAPPILCVSMLNEPASDEQQLVAAVQARVARPDVRVASCSALSSETPVWRVIVERVDPERIELTLTGKELLARRYVFTARLSRDEVVQQIALTAAELVRPSIDNHAKLAAASTPADDIVGALEGTAVCPPPPACPEPPPPAPVEPSLRPTLALTIGPLLGAPELDLAGYAELRGGVVAGDLVLELNVGGRNLGFGRQAEFEYGGLEIEAGVAGSWRWEMLQVGLRVQNRLSIVTLSGGAPAVPDTTQFFWRGGVAATAAAFFYRDEQWLVGIGSQLWLWPQPNSFLVRGETVMTQPHVELLVGPLVYFNTMM